MLKSTEIIKTKSFEIAIYKKGDMNSKKLALVLPGKLDTKDYLHMRSHVDLLAQKGYLAISYDPPGTWESGGDISLYNMTNYLKSIEEVIEYYGNRPTFVLGHSRGGSMAVIAGIKFSEVERFMGIQCGVDFSDYKASKTWIENGFNVSKRETPIGYEVGYKEFKLPISFVEDSWQYNMIEDLKKCSKPKCFIGATKDDAVPLDEIKEYYDICCEPKMLGIINSDHEYRKNDKAIQKVNRLIEQFLLKY